jgi:ubiquinone/menaquinone biosynthesis C-methylase UbiE
MRCPRCSAEDLRQREDGASCGVCNAKYASTEGILDMLGADSPEVITPFQHIMQTRLIVSIYEKAWRRIGYYLASSRSFKNEMETVLSHLEGKDATSALDVACGPGVFTGPIAMKTKGIVVGFDLSWPMLRAAQRSLTAKGCKNFFLIRGTVFRLPFKTASFPLINCCGALHLFDRPKEALQEMARVVSPNGHLIAQTTIRPSHSGGLSYFLEKIIRFGFFDENELQDLLSSQGFRILKDERHRISYTFVARRNS